MPEEGVELLSHDDILRFEQIERITRVGVSLGLTKVRLTGGEPLVRKGIVDLVGMLSLIPGIKKLAMTTNGTLLAPLAAPLAASGLDSVNISLDTLDPARYARITRRGSLDDALSGIEAARRAGLPVKLNVVVMPDTTRDELESIRAYAVSIEAGMQTIAQYDLGNEKLDGGEYDRPPPCAKCNRLRLLANGVLRPCLHSDTEVRVDFSDIEGSFRKAVALKPGRGLVCTSLHVGQIGG
jgi:cyclic pyranopterin phosphate synthase